MSAVIPSFRQAAASRIDKAIRGDEQEIKDRDACIKRARTMLGRKIDEHKAPAYPAHALGALAAPCDAIASAGQVDRAMAGQCLLGAASLLTQGLWNVESLSGERPLSLNLATLGDSGDGKSTAQWVALRPVHEWQREAAEDFARDLADFERAKAKRKRGDEPPEAPQTPYRLIRDATVEGLRRDLEGGPCSQGVFTDEAAAILSGYGMSAEHRGKTAGVFSGLWDSGHLSVSRATGPRVERYGCRVALHWLIQPMAASETLADPMLSALGFWPRFLAAWPAPLPPRVARPFRPDTLPAIGAYWLRCAEMLETKLPEDADKAPVLRLEDDARRLLGMALEQFERESRRGDLRPVKPFGLRATEQACRVAGVLSAFAGRRTVGADHAAASLELVSYSLETWRAILDEGPPDPTPAHALRLYEWLSAKPGHRERLPVILQAGPACTRSKDRRDAALDLLTEHSLAKREGSFAHALAPECEP